MTRTILAVACAVLCSGVPPQWRGPIGRTQALAAAGQAAAQPEALPGALAPTATLPNEAGSVKFAVIGDTGTGGRAQFDIAGLLEESRARFPYELVLMLGDNMYGGERPSDFVRKFERPYRPLLRAGVTFHATLGNHDEPSQRLYGPFNMNGDRFYRFRRSNVEFFALDSTHMTAAQVNWVREALEQSDAEWKIPYFHHPIYSSGEKHGDETTRLQALIEPIFVQHGVDVVFSGHDHFYERLKPQKDIHYFIAGGSAKLREGNIIEQSTLTAKGFDTDHSFMLVEIAGDRLFFETISRKGQVVDSGNFRGRAPTAAD